MNPMLMQRLLGAGVLLLLLFVASLLLPAPSDPRPAEPGMQRVEIAVGDPRPIELPKPPAAEPEAAPLDDDEPGAQIASASRPAKPERRLPAAAPEASLELAATEESDDLAPAPVTDDEPPAEMPAERPPPSKPAAVSKPPPVATTTPARPAAVVPKPAPKSAPAETKPRPPAPSIANRPPAPVIDEAPKPQRKPEQKPTTAPPTVAASPVPAKQRWAVQAGSYAEIANARQIEAQLKALGFASSISVTESGGSARYRVRSGPFATREAADAARLRMQQNRISASVVADGA